MNIIGDIGNTEVKICLFSSNGKLFKKISFKTKLINKRKFCGILQEITFNKKFKFMIVGIGINLIKNPIIKNYPTTNILTETGVKVKKLKLIRVLENNYANKIKLFA